MANAKIGSHPSYGYQVAETITEARQLDASDSGKVFYVDQGGSTYVINLPKLSTGIAGWHAKFFLTAVDASVEINAFGVVAGGVATSSTYPDADKMYLVEIGATEATTALSDGIAFGASAATLGSSIEIHCNGTYWFATGLAVIAADILSVDA